MKAPWVILCAALLVSGMTEGWAQGKYVAAADEELYGTWTNRRTVADVWHPQKLVFAPDRIKAYISMADTASCGEAVLAIDSRWTDSEGNVLYKYFATWTSGHFMGQKFQLLVKLSQSMDVSESVSKSIGLSEFSPDRFPMKVDSKDPSYEIRYRVSNDAQ